jgi:hypothetical protein
MFVDVDPALTCRATSFVPSGLKESSSETTCRLVFLRVSVVDFKP